MLGGLAGPVMENPTPQTFNFALDRAVNYGLMTPAQKQEVMAQYGGSPETIKGYAAQIFKGSISAQAQQADATSRANNAATVAASYYGHNVSAANNQRTVDATNWRHLNPTPQIVTGENGFYTINPRDPNSARPVGMAPPPPTPQPSINNALVNPATASTIVNAPTNSLLPTTPSQTGAPTVANAPVTQLRPPVKEQTPSLTEVANPDNPMETLRVDAKVYKGGGVGSAGVLGVVKTNNLNPVQQQKIKTEMAKDFKAIDKTVAETNALLESIDAVRNSNLERVAGPIDARTFTMSNEGKLAETRFENLKGKVTAIAKTAASMSGAIGSIANQEWQILANQIAVLDLKNGKEPSLEQIDQLERQALGIVNRMRSGFERQYGDHLDDLGPQYKEIPNVTYTAGSAGYTPKGKKTSTQEGIKTPAASETNIINFSDMPK
jgi:hypothetical protein